MFIASEYYGGRLIVKTLRCFENEREAWIYLMGMSHMYYSLTEEFMDYRCKVYEIYKDKPPRLCKYDVDKIDKPVIVADNIGNNGC